MREVFLGLQPKKQNQGKSRKNRHKSATETTTENKLSTNSVQNQIKIRSKNKTKLLQSCYKNTHKNQIIEFPDFSGSVEREKLTKWSKTGLWVKDRIQMEDKWKTKSGQNQSKTKAKLKQKQSLSFLT